MEKVQRVDPWEADRTALRQKEGHRKEEHRKVRRQMVGLQMVDRMVLQRESNTFVVVLPIAMEKNLAAMQVVEHMACGSVP